MKIQRIKLLHFGCHNKLDLRFQPGLNIIKGPNGSGKSTLQRALLKLLFAKPSRTDANEKDRSWESERLYSLALDFEVAGRGQGHLSKDFENNRCRLIWHDGEELTTFADVDNELKNLLNIRSEKLFKSTLFLAQNELAELSGDKEITTSLEERVTGGDAGITTQKALDRLAKEIDRYGKGYGPGARTTTKPGLIVATQKEKHNLEQKIADLRQRLGQFQQFQSQHRQIEQQLKAIQSELASKRVFVSQIDKVKRLREQVTAETEVEQQYDAQLEVIEKAQRDLSTSEKALRALGSVSQLEPRHHQTLSQMRSQVEFLEKQPIPAPPQAPRPLTSQKTIWPIVLLVIGLIGIAVGAALAWLLADSLFPLVPIVLGMLCAMVGLCWWMIQRTSQRTVQEGILRQAQQQAQQHAMMLKQQEQAKAKAQSDLQQALATLGCTTWQQYLAKQAYTNAEKSRRDQAQARLDAILPRGKSLTELQEMRRIASRARRDAEESLASPELLPAIGMTPLAHQNLLREIEQLAEKNGTLQKTFYELNGHLSSQSVSPTELLQAEEQLEALNQRITQYKELLTVYLRAQEVLLKAREQTIKRVRHDLENDTSRYFAFVTFEQFESVEIDDELSMIVAVPGIVERSIKPQELSCATQDQLYFAMRLALIDSLWVDNQPPLFLDDPFVTFDPQRRNAALQLCCNLATTRQIFLFTCSDDYDAYGNVLSLESSELFAFARQLQTYE